MVLFTLTGLGLAEHDPPTAGTIVNVPEATALSLMPDLNALAFSVVVEVIFKGFEHTAEVTVGSVPFVVHRNVAPAVDVDNPTVTETWNIPDCGLKVGVATGERLAKFAVKVVVAPAFTDCVELGMILDRLPGPPTSVTE